MNRSDNTSWDPVKIADSLRGELAKLHPVSGECCIYRVPQRIRKLNEGNFTPQAVSIGPLHYGSKELKVMEELKRRYLQDFLRRTQVRLEEFLEFLLGEEIRLRNCYSETIKLEPDAFVKMILLDAAFLFELIVRHCFPQFTIPDEGNFRQFVRVLGDVKSDLFLVENQLPMFILLGLFELARIALPCSYGQVSFRDLTCNFFQLECKQLLIDEQLMKTKFYEAEHFIDLIRLCLQPSEPPNQSELKTLTTSTVTELHHAGVKFKLGSSDHLFHITFKDGILEIPKLQLYMEQTETLFRNLKEFERLHAKTNYVNDYITIINYLVNAPNDVEQLMKDKIIENWLGNTAGVPTLFHNLLKECSISPFNFYYSGLVEDLNGYCKNPWHKWKASLKQDYFNTPWASISVLAAVILLVLTFLQTVFTILKP